MLWWSKVENGKAGASQGSGSPGFPWKANCPSQLEMPDPEVPGRGLCVAQAVCTLRTQSCWV